MAKHRKDEEQVLHESAASQFERLTARRAPFLDRGRKAAALTLPMLLPREDDIGGGVARSFVPPQQSLGARGVNHLAARLLLTLLPPGSSFFRLDIDPIELDHLAQDKAVHAEIEKAFRKIEDSTQRLIETQAMRVSGAEIFKHLIVVGNVCQHFAKSGGMSYFPLSHYVCERDADGDEAVLIVVREWSSLMALPKDVQDLVKIRRASTQEASSLSVPCSMAPDVAIYTRAWRMSEKLFGMRQELADGTVIPETYGTYPPDALPLRPLRWTKVKGEAYGRGLAEEYAGDLMAMEMLSKALLDGAVAAARVLGMVAPNSSTHPSDLNKARNGEFVRGHKDDVTFLQLEKFADFRTAGEQAAVIQRRLESAFLLNSSVIRNAERVTAEEIRFASQELESALGGVYSILGQEFQLPLATILIRRQEKARAIPKIPKSVKPVVVTGVAALGRFAELERLRAALSILRESLGPEVTAANLNIDPLVTYVLTQAGVRIEGLIKTAAEREAEAKQAQQAAMMQEVVKGGIGPAATALGNQSLSKQEAAQVAPPTGG